MKTRHRLLLLCLLCLLCAAHTSGCRSARATETAAPAPDVPVATVPDTTRTPPGHVSKPAGLLGFLSTPAGSARRQQRKTLRAATPKKLGKGAVYAPLATDVVNAYKPRQAVIRADSGAVVTAIDKVKAPVAIGAGATATSTTSKGISLWWLLLPAAGLAYWLYRKTIPFA
ncbi:hypothetical protein BEN47_06225 [Hymenobacter lapidarius]|uniref:Uncharacterized protein n=1 Tax=Hymenobacter lapidarius TaxID=1908237 RepID=A0A1G1SQF1_9BACT|nr:hypothetical protein [Hymenobacter lapidarius]OGX80851.1 hypothetical protein BEN47_06225 [Hymenobacter lapidarius]